jgi:hypothetical protein
MTTEAIPAVTEQTNPLTQDLDIAGARGIIRLLRQTDAQIFSGWRTFDSLNDKPCLDNLEALCQAIYPHIKHKGTDIRIFIVLTCLEENVKIIINH